MAGFDIYEAKTREELSYQGDYFVWDILASSPSNEQRRLLKSNLARILEWEVAKMVQRLRQDVQWDSKLMSFLAIQSLKVAEQKLADRV
jgi:hypothetical protein